MMSNEALVRELVKLENRFAAVAIVAKHARRLRDATNMEKSELYSLGEFVEGKIQVDETTLPESLREEEVEIVEAGQKKKTKRRKSR